MRNLKFYLLIKFRFLKLIFYHIEQVIFYKVAILLTDKSSLYCFLFMELYDLKNVFSALNIQNISNV